MLGIIIKDLWEAVLLKKNLISTVIVFISVIIMILLFPKHVSFLFLFVTCAFPTICTAPIQYSLEQDDISHFDEILLTYPIYKKEIVLAKFMACLIYSAITWIITFLIMLVYVCIYQVTDMHTGLLIWYIGVLVSLAFSGLFSICFYLFGNKKGAVIYIALVLIFASLYGASTIVVDWSVLSNISTSIWVVLGTLLSIIILSLSYFACVKIYTVQHSK